LLKRKKKNIHERKGQGVKEDPVEMGVVARPMVHHLGEKGKHSPTGPRRERGHRVKGEDGTKALVTRNKEKKRGDRGGTEY